MGLDADADLGTVDGRGGGDEVMPENGDDEASYEYPPRIVPYDGYPDYDDPDPDDAEETR